MRILFIIFSLFALGSAARAQNLQLSEQPIVIDRISVADMITFLQQAQFQAEFSQEIGQGQSSVKIITATADGGTFYFGMRQCTGPGISALCQLVEPFGYFNGSGVTLAQVNEFNLTKANASLAGLIPDGRGLVASKIWLNQGVTAANFGFRIGLFFMDVDLMLNAINPGTLASVSYDEETISAGGLAAASYQKSDDIDWKVNSVGHNAPDFMNDNIRDLVDQAGVE